MSEKERYYQISIMFGWLVLLHVVVIMFLISLLLGAVENDFSEFNTHPGEEGVNIMIVVFMSYAVMPLLVRLLTNIICRWIFFAFSILAFLLFLSHHLTHVFVDRDPMTIFNILDFTHHAVSIFLMVLTFFWAREYNK